MAEKHNQQAAAAWSRGGSDYNLIAFGVSDALAHAVQRLWPRPGERILDVATGTGWSARNAALLGAQVIGVDIADDLLAAARAISAHIEPAIDFQHGDAEALPFPDERFDGVISTFGVMFAPNQEQAAFELARVCKPGGRLVLTTWGPSDLITEFFAIIGKYSGQPPPEVSPLVWGQPDRVEELLGRDFELDCRTETSTFFAPDGEAMWQMFSRGFGPIRALAERLSEEDRAAFRQDVIDFHEEYRAGDVLRFDREYLLTSGIRR